MSTLDALNNIIELLSDYELLHEVKKEIDIIEKELLKKETEEVHPNQLSMEDFL